MELVFVVTSHHQAEARLQDVAVCLQYAFGWERRPPAFYGSEVSCSMVVPFAAD